MGTETPKGIVQFCVEAIPASDQTALSQHRRIMETSQRLIELLDRFEVAVTWAVPHPERTDLVTNVLTARQAHELALYGDASWIGAETGMAFFRRELKARVALAEENNIQLTSLVTNGVRLTAALDTLAKQGFTAVRDSVLTNTQGTRARARSNRNGTWRMTATARFPSPATLWNGWSNSSSLRRGIREANIQRQHIVIDLGSLMNAGAKSFIILEGALAHVVAGRHLGKLQIETMRDTANRLSHQYRPAKSILHSAA